MYEEEAAYQMICQNSAFHFFFQNDEQIYFSIMKDERRDNWQQKMTEQ